MVAGIAIGLTLGPKSALLEADAYKLTGSVTVLTDKADPETKLEIKLPAKTPLRLDVVDTTTVELTDRQGNTEVHPSVVHVRFEFTRQMALRDKTGELRQRLGASAVGDTVEAWLVIQHIELDSGGFVSVPEPISGFGDSVISWLSPIGKLFMRLIQFVIVPLVFASLLVGVAGLGDVRKLGRLGGKTLALYLGTTAFAVALGVVCAHALQPGSFLSDKDKAALTAQYSGEAGSRAEAAADSPSALDNILAIIPVNPVESLASGQMLQIIFFALIFGVALTLLKEERSRQVVDFFDTVQHAMIVIINMVMALAPFGVAALLAEVVGQSGLSVLWALIVYALTVMVGLALHASLVYGGLVKFVARLPVRAFLRAVRPAQLIAFSTSSSSATMPVTLECAEQNLRISNSVSSFVIPLGATVNMDGTALYQGVAAIFIAQVFDVDLSLGAQLAIILSATAASIGAAGVPGAGMITLTMVLTAAGIPLVGVALILGVDRILDMFRTMINVTGDLAVAASVAVSEGETLRMLSPDEDERDPTRGFEGRLDREPEPIEPSGDPLSDDPE
jgi:Na+/H+-dicarboxylate symporter